MSNQDNITSLEPHRAVLRAEEVSRTYGSAHALVHACQNVSVEAFPGQLLVIQGRSGAGKTTLLNILGGLSRPDNGRVWLGDVEMTSMPEDELVELRRTQLGFVFQSFGLIPILSAAENVEIPLRIQRMEPDRRDARVRELLEMVGLAKHGSQRPAELSGGQQQRVGLARALANRPQVLIADEPTGQLDSGTASAMMDLIGELVQTQGVAAIVSTHDPALIQRADNVVQIHDGRLRV
ncbi:ABC transporter ATP-binding protein [Arthrobacter sp. ok362]|uniref:ABC transporter ATP-binding protein n=1 Tax=Arthrobacter sp. ok362 TaxID=1761745 RepID=UPI0008926A97|nr:ABC transporter ATP-binding protein [Arthrobacter sp. ok362]SDK60161.1 putative ABC transport system ATP-binding protein [Arthrobacter sp. ok362]